MKNYLKTTRLLLTYMTSHPYNSATNPFGDILDLLQPKLAHATSRILKDFCKDVDSRIEPPGPIPSNDFDIFQTDSHYCIYVDCPGVDKDQVNVVVNESMLTISYERKHTLNDAKPVLIYRKFGKCVLDISLKNLDLIDTSVIVANMHNGVLCIRIPKIQNKPSRKIIVE